MQILGLVYISATIGYAQSVESRLDGLEAAIQHLAVTYLESYTNHDEFQLELAALRELDDAHFTEAFSDLQRRALCAHPDLLRYPLVFVERKQYPRDHHNTGTIFQTGEINHRSVDAVLGCRIRLLRTSDGQSQTLYETPGVLRDIEVSFDASRILFFMRESRDVIIVSTRWMLPSVLSN